MEYSFALLAAGFAVAVAVWHVAELPGRRLRARFRGLGRLPGLTTDDIVSAVGAPHSYDFEPDGRTLCRWRAGDFEIALLFDGYLCEAVTGVREAA